MSDIIIHGNNVKPYYKYSHCRIYLFYLSCLCGVKEFDSKKYKAYSFLFPKPVMQIEDITPHFATVLKSQVIVD